MERQLGSAVFLSLYLASVSKGAGCLENWPHFFLVLLRAVLPATEIAFRFPHSRGRPVPLIGSAILIDSSRQ